MFQLGKTIVSEDIIEKDFVCNLSACKGACCVEGDAGAPLDEEEVKILDEIYPKVKPFLRKRYHSYLDLKSQNFANDIVENQGIRLKIFVINLIILPHDFYVL